MSAAKVSIWNTTVGYLYWDEQLQSTLFEADEEYLKSPFNIAPFLHPHKSEGLSGANFPKQFKGMIPTFNDSLPDAFGNIVFKEWLEQRDLDQSKMNPVERLLYIGKRGIGALEYHIGKEIPGSVSYIDLNELAEISNKIIERKYTQEDYLHDPEALSNILTIGSSVGGAQAKILIAETKDHKLLAGDVLHDRPVDYYIVKLEHDSQNIWNREKNFIEFVYNSIAADIGINVAPSKLISEGNRTHFATKRFDRNQNKKIHKQTVNALSGFWGKSLEFGYADIFKIIESLRLPYSNAEQLFLQMVFNVASSNRDDHTKNFAFLMSEEGQWQLSPAYDLTYPRDPYENFAAAHQIHINGKTRDIERKDVVAVAKLAGIRNYNPLIDHVREGMMTFSERVKEFPLESNTTKLIAKEIEENVGRLG